MKLNPLYLPILLGLLFFLGAPAASHADDTATYSGTLTGVECTACKKTIAQSLSKIKGVQTIRIIKNGATSHRLEVITDRSKTITKADATAALKNAEHYKILSWSKTRG